jgi:hypothetical protein
MKALRYGGESSVWMQRDDDLGLAALMSARARMN